MDSKEKGNSKPLAKRSIANDLTIFFFWWSHLRWAGRTAGLSGDGKFKFKFGMVTHRDWSAASHGLEVTVYGLGVQVSCDSFITHAPLHLVLVLAGRPRYLTIFQRIQILELFKLFQRYFIPPWFLGRCLWILLQNTLKYVEIMLNFC